MPGVLGQSQETQDVQNIFSGLLTDLSPVERALSLDLVLESLEHRSKTGGNFGGRSRTMPRRHHLFFILYMKVSPTSRSKSRWGLPWRP